MEKSAKLQHPPPSSFEKRTKSADKSVANKVLTDDLPLLGTFLINVIPIWKKYQRTCIFLWSDHLEVGEGGGVLNPLIER